MEKHIGKALILFGIGFLVLREAQLVHHFIVISRDYYPVMSYFYQQGILYLLSFASTASAGMLGIRQVRYA